MHIIKKKKKNRAESYSLGIKLKQTMNVSLK